MPGVPAGTEPFSGGGLALFYLGFFREEVGGGRGICRRLCMTPGCTIQRGGLARQPRQDHVWKGRSGRDAEQRDKCGDGARLGPELHIHRPCIEGFVGL